MNEAGEDWDFETFKAEWNRNRGSPFDFEQWCKDVESHPAFMSGLPSDGIYSEALESLQAMKYDQETTPEEQAMEYKSDGNFHFKCKHYDKAIIAYTEGIKLNCNNNDLNADLYNNRSACHYFLENYRSSFKDCVYARRYNAQHKKVFKRGIDCLLKLECPLEVLKWMENAGPTLLSVINNVDSLRQLCVQKIKEKEKENRRYLIKQAKFEKDRQNLIELFQNRGVRFQGLTDLNELQLNKLNVDLPQCSASKRVYFSQETASLHWPVLFLYPERNTTDFIEDFDENSRFSDHLAVMFESCSFSEDLLDDFKSDYLEIYFEPELSPDQLIRVPSHQLLREVLSSEKYRVIRGLPSFLILSNKSKFTVKYLDRFKVMDL